MSDEAESILRNLVAKAKSDGYYKDQGGYISIEADWVPLTEAESAFLAAVVSLLESEESQ